MSVVPRFRFARPHQPPLLGGPRLESPHPFELALASLTTDDPADGVIRMQVPILKWIQPPRDFNGVLQIGQRRYMVQEFRLATASIPEIRRPRGSRFFVIGEQGDTHTFRLNCDDEVPARCVCPDKDRCLVMFYVAVAYVVPGQCAA